MAKDTPSNLNGKKGNKTPDNDRVIQDRNMQLQWPRTLEEAVNIHLLTMTAEEKAIVKNTLKKDLINFHFRWGLNMRNEFGLWEGNDGLIESCGAFEPDGACMAIIEAVWEALQDTVT